MEIKYAYLVGEEIAAIQVLNFQLYGCIDIFYKYIYSKQPVGSACLCLVEWGGEKDVFCVVAALKPLSLSHTVFAMPPMVTKPLVMIDVI